jgi:anthranilate synthase/aminodeoxychorismate synthase-like glutamine amidotransferase
MILIIDNYDSFVYNLARYFEVIGCDVVVSRNDRISIQDIITLNPEAIIISPGPCTPLESGLSIEIVRYFYKKIPILGVCLGHQVIGHVFGGVVNYAKQPMHGRSSIINLYPSKLFENIPPQIQVGRYHSLIVSLKDYTVDSDLSVIATSDNSEIMAIELKNYPVYGVQFHPESVLTEYGLEIIKNFVKIVYN